MRENEPPGGIARAEAPHGMMDAKRERANDGRSHAGHSGQVGAANGIEPGRWQAGGRGVRGQGLPSHPPQPQARTHRRARGPVPGPGPDRARAGGRAVGPGSGDRARPRGAARLRRYRHPLQQCRHPDALARGHVHHRPGRVRTQLPGEHHRPHHALQPDAAGDDRAEVRASGEPDVGRQGPASAHGPTPRPRPPSTSTSTTWLPTSRAPA